MVQLLFLSLVHCLCKGAKKDLVRKNGWNYLAMPAIALATCVTAPLVGSKEGERGEGGRMREERRVGVVFLSLATCGLESALSGHPYIEQ